MTMPLISYFILVAASLPESLPSAAGEFLLLSVFPVEKGLIMVGLVVVLYASVYLHLKKRTGLVTTGPYRLVRHPQYLGAILLTMGFTSWSYWVLTHTFGIGFLTPTQTIAVWVIELLAYVTIAGIEEVYLLKAYGELFEQYQNTVPFLIPGVSTRNRWLDTIISTILPTLMLMTLVLIQS